MRRAPLLLLPLAILSLHAVAAPSPAAAAAPEAPVPLGETASAPARVAAPASFAVPQPSGILELAPGESTKRVEDRVTKGQPTAWRFVAPAGTMISIGVSSPKADVRLSVFEIKTGKMLGGTEPENGAIRVTTEYPEATELLLIAHTQGDETPFRFELNLGAGSM